MAKYSKEIISVRKSSNKEILSILKKGPSTLPPIYKIIKNKHPKSCDDSVICSCGNRETSRTEWKHQVRWALQDLRYSGIISYYKKTKEYSLK